MKHKIKTAFLPLVIAATTLLTTGAHAAVIVSETFTYANGGLNGSNGGTGFGAAWVSGAGYSVADNKASVTANGNQLATRSLATPLTTTGQVYFSIEFNKANATGSTSLQFMSGTTELVWAGINTSEWRLGVTAGAQAGSTATLDVSQVLTGVIDYANDKVVLWAPENLPTGSYDISTGEATGATLQAAFTSSLAINGIRLGAGGSGSGTYDDIRIATAGSDVGLSVIPEPSTALLGGLGFLVLLRRRR